MQLPKQLYAPSLKERWNNTLAWIKEKGEPQGGALAEVAGGSYLENEFFWPCACFGSVNSWLLIVGPSSGGSPPPESLAPSEWRKFKYHLFVGASHPGFTFRDGSNYFKRVSELVDNFFRVLNLDASVGRALTHHSNLLPTKSGKQPNMSGLSSEFAIKRITRIFQETHPRLMIALTKDVFEVLQTLWKQLGYTKTKGGLLKITTSRWVYKRKWELWELENNDKILFARIHQHPTKPGFKEGLQEFVTKLAKIARKELNADPDF